MTAKRPRSRRKQARVKGPRGPRGKTGRPGPPGKAGNGTVALLAAQMEQIVKELHTQLIRIGQIQAQLDQLASGQAPLSFEPGSSKSMN